jgi:hypothetical protein
MKKIKSKKNDDAIKLLNALVQKKIYTPQQVSSFLKDDFFCTVFVIPRPISKILSTLANGLHGFILGTHAWP